MTAQFLAISLIHVALLAYAATDCSAQQSPTVAHEETITVETGSNGWEALARTGIEVRSLKKKILLIPSSLRCREVERREFIQLMAQAHGLDVWWEEKGTGAVLYRKVSEAEVQKVLQDLTSPDEKVRRRGAWSSRWVVDVRLVEPLLAAYGSGKSVSAQVVESARDLGLETIAFITKEKAIPLLENSLAHREAAVRSETVQALGQIRTKKSFNLLEKAASDKDPGVRACVVETLTHYEGEKSVALLETILRKDKEASVQEAAARALGLIASEGSVKALRGAFEDGSPAVRRAAVAGFGLAVGNDTEALLHKALVDSDPWVRRAATRSLSDVDDASALPLLDKALQSEDVWIRQNAVVALGYKRGGRAFTLLERALNDSDPYLRRYVTRSLAQMCGERRIIPLLEQAQRDENVWVRRDAALALGEFGSKKAVELLGKALTDDSIVRNAAIRGLGRVGKESVPVLEKLLKDPDDMTRKSAVTALVDAADERGLQFVEAAFSDPSFHVRQGALSVAHRFPAYKIIPSLDRLAGDKLWFVRENVAGVLGKIGTEKALNSLEKLLNDETPEAELSGRVRLAAASALMRIGGERAKDILVARLPLEHDVYVQSRIFEALTALYSHDPLVKDLLKKASQPGQ